MQGDTQMNSRLVKRMFDACYVAKRTRDMLPSLPDGVQPSYIHYLDCIQGMEEKGNQVRVSDISDFLNIPRPGVTRTVKEMEAKGYLQKIASPDDGRVTFLTATEKGRKLHQKYDDEYFKALLPYMHAISEEEAENMIATIEKFYQIMSERREDYDKR